MKAVLIEAANKLAIRDIPESPLGDYQARTRLICGSICNSTDRKLLEGTFPGCTDFPALLGHEAVGEVLEIGAKVRNYRVGDLVIRPYQLYRDDPSGRDYGIREYFGSFGEFGKVVDQWAQWEDRVAERGDFDNPHQILPAGVDPAVGVMSITLKETLSWTRRFGIGPGMSVLVFGTGPVGATFALWAKQAGARQVILAGRTDASIERAATLCAPDATINIGSGDVVDAVREMTSGGVDRVIEGVGDNTIIDSGLQCLAEGGVLGVYGVPESTQEKARFADDPQVKNIAPDEAEVHDEFFQMVAGGTVDPMAFMTHRVPFADIDEGFRLLREREAFKVILDW